jgi:hypothetical protein
MSGVIWLNIYRSWTVEKSLPQRRQDSDMFRAHLCDPIQKELAILL